MADESKSYITSGGKRRYYSGQKWTKVNKAKKPGRPYARVEKNIYQRGNRYVVRVRQKTQGTFDTLEAARAFRDEFLAATSSSNNEPHPQ